MSQYLLSVYMIEDEDAPVPTPDEMQASFDAVAVFNTELQESGVWVFAGGLFPAETATVVKANGTDVVTTDGPFAETKEHLGGFWIVDVTDLDAALALAAKGSVACGAPVEVRPFDQRTDDEIIGA